jgi:hypothetical protein
MSVNPSTTLIGTVEKIIRSFSSEPERAQIVVEGADHLYRELRIENALTDAAGNRVQLKPGAKVQLTVEAEPQGVIDIQALKVEIGQGHPASSSAVVLVSHL